MHCQSLRAACAGTKTTTAGFAEAGAWFDTAADIYAAEIGLLHIGPVGARIGIREGATSDVSRWCAEAAGALRVSAVAVVVSGGGIDPVSSSSITFSIGHPRPPGMS
jgi:predicted TIM-barrel enzyme